MIWRGVIVLAGVAMAGFTAQPALADPPGPTDYNSAVVSIEPAVEGIVIDIVAGDAFVVMSVSGRTVEVLGYDGEPYLRFLPDGTVERNQRAPATYLNEDRYAGADLPVGVSPDAEPGWVEVASDGIYAWHDHRTHWMNTSSPPGARPGDRILEGVIPLIVDGQEVDVGVASTWVRRPSELPAIAGIGLGLLVAAVAGATIRLRPLPLTLALGILALVAGLGDWRSVPLITEPSISLWLAPLLGVFVGLVALRPGLLGLRASVTPRLQALLGALAAAIVGGWGVWRWEWMWKAILPTGLPDALARIVTGAALAGGAGLALVLVRRARSAETSAA